MLTQPKPYRPCDDPLDDETTCISGSLFKRVVNTLNRPFQKYHPSPDTNTIALSYGMGQQFYTPDDISAEETIPDDRPYGGYLYGRIDIENTFTVPRLRRGPDWERDYVISKSLRFGMVGPASLAEEVQTWWHDVCSCTEPRGWDNQIRNEIGIDYTVRRQDRAWMRNLWSDRWQADFLTNVEGTVGNVFTGATIGAQFRLGYMLPRNFANMTISPVVATASAVGGAGLVDRAPLYVYGFLGGAGKVVLRDIFLDGNTFKTSPHTVDKEPLVGEVQFGGVVGWRNWELNILYAHRSDQFELQEQSHRFGQIKITYFIDM
jgi:hypothetical protein